MKKWILILFALLMTSTLSARIIFQTEALVLSNEIEIEHNCFNQVPDSFGYDFYWMEGLQFSLGYEFFTDRVEDDFHFFAGVDIGAISYFISAGGFAGFNYKLFETDWFRFELMTTLKAGEIEGIKGPCYYFIQTNADFVVNLKNRRFPYFGIGVSNTNTTNINIYKDFGTNIYVQDFLTMHVVAGIRL